MSRPSPALAEGRRTADWLSWMCAGIGVVFVAAWCVILVLSIGRSSPAGQWDVVGATGFAFGMVAFALTSRRELGGDPLPTDSETQSRVRRARRDAAASVGIALMGGVIGLLVVLSFCGVPSIHSEITWLSDRVPIAGFIILLSGVAALRVYAAGTAVGASDTWFRQPLANWARTIGLGVMAAYILVYGIMLVIGIIFLVLFLLFHLLKS